MRYLRSLGLGVVFVFAATTAWPAPVSGEAIEVGSGIAHPNGNVYDQVLLTGAVATIGADAGQATRISFRDLNEDIVQVEFSGKGTLTLSLANASAPAPAANYNQPDVLYVRGHASISISGSDATTHVAVFSVGRLTALNPSLLRTDVSYDGIADLAALSIAGNPANPDGASAFGSIRMGNVRFFATGGFTGIHAPDADVQGPVALGDLSAFDAAAPVLYFGDRSQFDVMVIAGGDLHQANGRPIQMKGFRSIDMMPGTTSARVSLPFQFFRGVVERGGLDVTQDAVLYPLVAVVSTVAVATARVPVGNTVPPPPGTVVETVRAVVTPPPNSVVELVIVAPSGGG